jgi:hypothetical protein
MTTPPTDRRARTGKGCRHQRILLGRTEPGETAQLMLLRVTMRTHLSLRTGQEKRQFTRRPRPGNRLSAANAAQARTTRPPPGAGRTPWPPWTRRTPCARRPAGPAEPGPPGPPGPLDPMGPRNHRPIRVRRTRRPPVNRRRKNGYRIGVDGANAFRISRLGIIAMRRADLPCQGCGPVSTAPWCSGCGR